jgi:hypothetical protein
VKILYRRVDCKEYAVGLFKQGPSGVPRLLSHPEHRVHLFGRGKLVGGIANPLNQPEPPASPVKSQYQWSWDDFFVAGLAVVCIPTAVVLVCMLPNQIPPIVPSVLLATGLAALIYRFLGGLEGANFQMGAFKAAGGLAALALITWGINHYLQEQDPVTRKVIYTITGTAVDENNQAVRMEDGDVLADPPPVTVQKNGTGSFTVEVSEDGNGNLATTSKDAVATIRISHLHCPVAPTDRPADIAQCADRVTLASEPVEVSWKSLDRGKREFWLGRIKLINQAHPTPSKDLKRVDPLPGEGTHSPQGYPAAVTHPPAPQGGN